jgi:fermentation-respiration switch protein FrsA (DUF1100 family)
MESAILKKKRRLPRIAVVGVCVYLVFCIGMYFIQDWLIFPGRSTQGRPDAVVRASTDYELVHLKTADGDPFISMFGRALDSRFEAAADSSQRPTLLFFYGNDMCLADSFSLFARFRRMGLNAMIVEYPGYGMSGGRASERSFYAASVAAFDYLAQRPDVNKKLIVAAGWSLGAAVATDLACHRPVMALATFSAFTSMTDMARLRAFCLPTGLLLDCEFNNLEKFRQMSCPIFMAHGKHDSVVPFAMFGKLTAGAKGPVTSVEIESDHNDLFEVGGAELDQAFGRWLGAVGE